MWWKGIIWPPTSSSWKAIPRAACLSGLITGSLLKIPSCSLLNPPSGRAPAPLFPSLEGGWSSSPALCWEVHRSFVGCSFGAFCCGHCLGGRAGRAGQPPGAAASLDSLWPPCLVIYLQLNSAGGRGQVFHLDKKKRALLKGTDLSITLFCRHGAFIAFLSTNPFPFLNHSNSPPPLLSILPGDLVVSLCFHRHLPCCPHPWKSWDGNDQLQSISKAGRCWVSLCAD